MKISAFLFLTLSSGAQAVGLGSLRGETAEGPIKQFGCTLQGAGSQNQCDATKSEDGSQCVWCEMSSYGVCVSESQASTVKQLIPGIDCDDDGGSDDDNSPKPPTPGEDDDVGPNDDNVPDDYWRCLEKYATNKECTGAGCAWCDNKGGYGVCFDKETAADFDDSDWYSCTMPSLSVNSDSSSLEDPSDPTCIAATIGGDESSCKGTMDSSGKPCDWCSFQGYGVCMNVDQAQIAEQYGASCGDDVETIDEEGSKTEVSDPADPSCLVVTIGGDESSCIGTNDADGKACDWCSFQGYGVCMNEDQAQIAEQYGASCGASEEDEEGSKTEVSDPADSSCLVVTIGGDESSCKGTKDSDGKACDWCSFQGYGVCMNEDQAQIAEQYGASCGDRDANSLPTSIA